MGNLLDFLTKAGAILADGLPTVEEAVAFFNTVSAVVNAGTDPTDADWDALHAYEAKQLAILNAPMGGE